MLLAWRGARDMDAGTETIVDPEELRHVRTQAARLHLEALFAAGALTGLAVLMAVWVGP